MPKISVIVPIYNVEKYLNRCVDSILNQTFEDFELILVNDGSPDNCGNICDEYAQKDNRVKVIHKKNGGVSSARNVGIDIAQGEYIMFVDSDDWIQSVMLEQMYVYNNSDLIISGLEFVDINNNILFTNFIDFFQNITIEKFMSTWYVEAEKKLLLSGPYNKLYKREIIADYNIKFNENISICEDGLFVTQYLLHCHKISNINKSFYEYIQYEGNSLMGRYNDNAIEANAILYNEKINLINSVCPLEDVKKFEYISISNLRRFINFFIQIYTRSTLGFWQKYKKVRQAISGKTFCKVLNMNIEKWNIHKILIKFAANTHIVFPIHCVYYFKYFKLGKGKQ